MIVQRCLLYSPAVDTRRLAVMTPFHSLFYAPQFVAVDRGFFADEGLEVTTEAAGGGRTTVSALLDGSIQIGLGGIMRSLDLADRDGRLLPHFIEVNSRNGFFLLAREPRPRFTWSDLVDKEVI